MKKFAYGEGIGGGTPRESQAYLAGLSQREDSHGVTGSHRNFIAEPGFGYLFSGGVHRGRTLKNSSLV